ncbi:hypothetical protein [Nocardiopsis sp. FIRDI 009]|uniref:hypothetical protein n=1 Tax=Nocardiopsis sp. FIRDI 009 TaxID=714197 RepID=UPI000E221C4C|nr:hypothetical protein [Nocardiopsis sp. FIRDI 009]
MSVPYPHPPGHPTGPVIDPRELRPRRLWYAVGAAVVATGLLGGFAGFVWAVFQTLRLPEFEAELRDPGEVVFTVGDGVRQLGLYTSPAGADADACVLVLPDGGERAFSFPPYGHDVETGSESWSLVGAAETAGGGEYTLACDGGQDTVHAVADIGDGGRTFVTNVLGAFAAIGGGVLVALAVGGPILVVTGVRRGRHKRRLIGERARPPHRG